MQMLKSVLLSALVVVCLASFLWSQDVCDLAGPPTGSYATADGDKVTPGVKITWTIHYTVATDAVKGLSNGFEVYISDQPSGINQLNPGPGFTPITFDTVIYVAQWLDGGFFFDEYSIDGFGADTVKYVGFSLFKPGIPLGFDGDVYTLSTGTSVSIGDQGYYLCVDSSWAPPGGSWLWSTNSGNVFPYWGGPYCYEIKTCCIGSKGNVDGSPDGAVTVSDLTALVHYVFPPHDAIPCEGAGDVDGQTAGGSPINVSDVTYLVAYLFQGGPAPAPCGS